MRWIAPLLACGILAISAAAQQTRPASGPAQAGDGNLPHLQIDVPHRKVRMECETVNADAALEFLVCAAGTKEHETVLRTRAKPSHLHFALVLIGLEPGEPAHYVEQEDRWVAPSGPALRITCQYKKEGKTVSFPATRLLRRSKDKKEVPDHRWVFCGSRLTRGGGYAADVTGDVISVVNFQHTVIDVPELKSDRNDALELEINPEASPARGTKVWLLIEPEPAETAKK